MNQSAFFLNNHPPHLKNSHIKTQKETASPPASSIRDLLIAASPNEGHPKTPEKVTSKTPKRLANGRTWWLGILLNCGEK